MPSTLSTTATLATTALADVGSTNAVEPVRQQTFEFWQPEVQRPAKLETKPKKTPAKPDTKAAKPATKPKPRQQKPSQQKPSQQRTQRWANMTVATLRHAESPAKPIAKTNQPAKPRQSAKSDASAGRASLMADLRNRAAAIATSPAMENAETFSTGSAAMDTWLPSGGLKRGRICEWVATRESGGAGTLSMITTASAIADQTGPVIVIDPTETFYASGAIACGIPADRIVWCRCSTRRDSVWALDQALRCQAVAAVWAMLPWHLGDQDARRLQLAAETGRTPGLFVLTAGEAHRPSFAPVRFHVDPVRSTDAAKRWQPQSEFSRPPVDIRAVRVRMNEKKQAVLAITPDAKLRELPTGAADHTETLHEATRHEAVAVSLAARLADPTSTRRHSTGLDSVTRNPAKRRTG